MKLAYLECRSGISGDMMLGALVDVGVPLELLVQTVDQLGVGAALQIARVQRSGISGSKVDVVLNDPHQHGRAYQQIRALIDTQPLEENARKLAQKAFRLLAEAEAKIHAVAVDEVHFHEVGSADAIVDIVASAVGLIWLGVDKWSCSALNVGGGSVRCAHGVFPVPAPATLELLKGSPVYSEGPALELITPTGAALLRSLDVEFGRFPAMKFEGCGYGAGSRDFEDFPNLLRLSTGLAGASEETEQVAVLEASIDDCSPEVLAFACEQLLELGVLDVYQSPITMKKGRAATLLTVICKPNLAVQAQRMLLRETTTLGVRLREQTRMVLVRDFATAQTEWGPVPIKVSRFADGVAANAAPEYESCKKIAVEAGIPLKRVLRRSLECYRESL